MERLGDKLKRVEADMAERKTAQAETEQAAAERADRSRHEAVRNQFEAWKRDIAAAILGGELPPALRIATAPPIDGRTSWLISAPQSPDHDLFLEFQKWATEQGLQIKANHADGRGGGGALLTVASST